MKKALKVIRDIFLWTLAALILILLTIPIWSGPVLRPIVNAIAPKVTKTDFGIDHLSINPYTARVEVGGFLLGNPSGYSEPNAVTLGKLVFDADPASLVGDVIHIEDITVEDVDVTYLKGGENDVYNFAQLQENVMGKKVEDGGKAEEGEKPKESEAVDKGGKEKRFVIDHLRVSGIRIKLGFMTIPVPTLELNDIGKSSGGATIGEICDEVWQKICEMSADIGQGIMNLSSDLGEGAKKLGEKTGRILQSLGTDGGKAVDGLEKEVKKSADKLKKLIKF